MNLKLTFKTHFQNFSSQKLINYYLLKYDKYNLRLACPLSLSALVT